MTVIKKKGANAPKGEPGVRYYCDICAVEITSTVGSCIIRDSSKTATYLQL